MISNRVVEYLVDNSVYDDIDDNYANTDNFFAEKEQVVKDLTPDEIVDAMLLLKDCCENLSKELDKAQSTIEELEDDNNDYQDRISELEMSIEELKNELEDKE